MKSFLLTFVTFSSFLVVALLITTAGCGDFPKTHRPYTQTVTAVTKNGEVVNVKIMFPGVRTREPVYATNKEEMDRLILATESVLDELKKLQTKMTPTAEAPDLDYQEPVSQQIN